MPLTRTQLNNDLISVLTPIIDVPQHHQANGMILDYVDQQIGTVTGDTWTAVKNDYYTKPQVNTLVASSASTLSQYQVGVGDANNKLSGGNTFTWDGNKLFLSNGMGKNVHMFVSSSGGSYHFSTIAGDFSIIGESNLPINMAVHNGPAIRLTGDNGIQFWSRYQPSYGMWFTSDGKLLLGGGTDQGDFKIQVDGSAYFNGNAHIKNNLIVGNYIAADQRGGGIYEGHRVRIQSPSTSGAASLELYSSSTAYYQGAQFTIGFNEATGERYIWNLHTVLNDWAGPINFKSAFTGRTMLSLRGQYGGMTWESIPASDGHSENGTTFYRVDTHQFRGYRNGVWKNFLMEGDVADAELISEPDQQLVYGMGNGIGSSANFTYRSDISQLTIKTPSYAANAGLVIDNTSSATGTSWIDFRNVSGSIGELKATGSAFTMNKKLLIGGITDQGNYSFQVDGSILTNAYLKLASIPSATGDDGTWTPDGCVYYSSSDGRIRWKTGGTWRGTMAKEEILRQTGEVMLAHINGTGGSNSGDMVYNAQTDRLAVKNQGGAFADYQTWFLQSQFLTTSGSVGDYNDITYVDATTGNITVNTPAASNVGRHFKIKRTDNTTNTVTVYTDGGNHYIDGGYNVAIPPLGYLELVCEYNGGGLRWQVISAKESGASVGTLQDVTTAGNTTANDVEITDAAKGVIMKSPDGNRWRVTVDNNGALTSTQII